MKRIVLLALCVLLGVLILVACTEAQTSVLQTMVAQPAAGQAAATPLGGGTTSTPGGFSMLATPTLDPVADGPLGTWTAIAKTFVLPTPDPTQYEIVLRGKPHFIEFHAWW
jgi:hypothetical protein